MIVKSNHRFAFFSRKVPLSYLRIVFCPGAMSDAILSRDWCCTARGFFRLSKDAYVSQSYYESVKDTNFCFFDVEFNDNDF